MEMKIARRIVLVLVCVVCLAVLLGETNVVPQFAVIGDMVKVGLDYVSLNRNTLAPSAQELADFMAEAQEQHPFVLANAEHFETARAEYINSDFTAYTGSLCSYVLANADGLLNEEVYPLMEYVLDEEDSILPISREMINRIVILGYAWQITGDKKYAEKAVAELENVCSYDDWCTGHFLATAEMALAVSIGYDWFYDYLSQAQRDMLAETTLVYAIQPALSRNYLKNWFTWSKNNWNSICYSGVGIACLTFSDYYPEECAAFLSMCYKNMSIAFENFTPDGVYAEGSGYCQSGMNAVVYFIATSNNYLRTDFGLSEIDGFKELGYFPVYITAPTGVFNFGDNKGRLCFSPSLHWYADTYDAPLLSFYQSSSIPAEFVLNPAQETERNGLGRETALACLWYNRDYEKSDVNLDNEPKNVKLRSDVGQELAIMRSAYLDENATFAAIKGGYNFINHGDLDVGTFVLDSMGVRWAEELGPAAYDVPGYFNNLPLGGRWNVYCKRAEGQNTLVINPTKGDDQYVLGRAEITDFENTDGGAKCTLDMSDAYIWHKAKKVVRNFEMYNNSTSLKITDEIECRTESEIYWFMHTKADIAISADKKSAVLTIGDKQMQAVLLQDGEFSVMEAESLFGRGEYDDAYENIKKLTVHIEDVKQASICVALEPME